jgi:hypothetical protein
VHGGTWLLALAFALVVLVASGASYAVLYWVFRKDSPYGDEDRGAG